MSTPHSGETEGPPTILVVDDESTVREFITKLAAELGYHAITAKDGLDAMELCVSAGPFAAVVTGVHMPRVDGVRLGRSIRRDLSRSIPIIFISRGLERPGFFYTMHDLQSISPYYMQKPIDGARFKDLLQLVLQPITKNS